MNDKETPKNGDSVIFLIKNDNTIYIGKIVSEFNCVITQDGTVVYNENIESMWVIPINRIQETIYYNDKFLPAYESLVSMNSVKIKTEQIEEFIETNVNKNKDKLSDDKQFLVDLFTRNVKNEKIDFPNYRFMIDVLFDKPIVEFSNKIDLRELNSICYNMYSIMERISKETYDKIYEKLAEFTTENNSL